jgi:hypothetical protein
MSTRLEEHTRDPEDAGEPAIAARAAAWQQRLKWGVYALLFLDFLLYVAQDVESAPYTLPAHPTLLQWARAYVTSIDLAAWFVLILFFELETYALADRPRGGARRWAVQGVRALCYVAILHTTVADVGVLLDFHAAKPLPDAVDACAYADGGWSFLENRGYTTIDAQNCAVLGAGPAWFVVGSEPVIVDQARLREGRILAWTDVVENLAWLLIVAINEVIVRIQERGFGTTALLTVGNRLKGALYTLIVCIALYWGSKDQVLYLWDELLWVGGFALIEKNIFEWRARLLERPA